MPTALIPGGYILLARKIIDSGIFAKPPLYLKVWIYLLSCAQHGNYKGLSRGCLRTSIADIIEACGWHAGYRKEYPTKDQIFQVLDWLRRAHGSLAGATPGATMITTTRATQGMLITIGNYDRYQSAKNYESNSESNDGTDTGATREQHPPDNINKNDKNERRNKEEEEATSVRWLPDGNGGFDIPEAVRKEWRIAYPRLNTGREIDRAAQWYRDNPKRRKKDHRRFLSGWLRRANDGLPPDPFENWENELPSWAKSVYPTIEEVDRVLRMPLE